MKLHRRETSRTFARREGLNARRQMLRVLFCLVVALVSGVAAAGTASAQEEGTDTDLNVVKTGPTNATAGETIFYTIALGNQSGA
ncbi:MAG TPA: hypothetical protein VJT82_01900, partial [Pyrinomonadaceae bacterium]|nr:hypothetical protein [Pyrinomonadaceae bacterium]